MSNDALSVSDPTLPYGLIDVAYWEMESQLPITQVYRNANISVTDGKFYNLSGSDTVTGGNQSYWIAGINSNHNTISLGDGNNAVGMTGEGNIVHLGNGNNSLALYGSNNSATLGNGNNTLGVEGQNGNFVLGSGHNAVGIGRFSGSEHMTFAGSSVNLIDDIGCGGNTFDLGSSTTALVAADQENINVSGGAAIVSGGSDLNIQIGAKGELMQIVGFSNDLINLDPSLGFASVSDVVSALQSDGKGGGILSLHGHGLIDFAGVDPSSLQASNFHIG